jgi:hypothetical protein
MKTKTSKEIFQDAQLSHILKTLKELEKKAKLFHKKNHNSWAGDLGYIADELDNINSFIK